MPEANRQLVNSETSSKPNDVTVIYALFDPRRERNFEIRYIGKTINIVERIRFHLKDKHNNRRGTWIKSLKRKSLKPEVEILEECYGEEWKDAEKFWISYFRFIGARLTNVTEGGHGGSHITMDARKKLSIRYKGKKRPPFSELHRARLSAAAKVSKWDRGAHNKKVWTGRNHSPESRAKISASRLLMLKKKKLEALALSSNEEQMQTPFAFPE